MATRGGAVHVVTTKRTYKGREYRTHLLRRSYRDGDRVCNETLGNLSHLPDALIEVIRRSLKGERFVPVDEAFQIIASRPQGHVHAVQIAMQRVGLASLLASAPSRQRDLVCAMVAARVLAPLPKLATSRWWHSTTLATDFGVADADEDELYAAMDWLLERQDAIQKKLATRHLADGAMALFDLSSSYVEGTCCPLAKRGYSRDGRPGTLQINYGLLTDVRGCPLSVSVYEGNVADPQTLLPEVRRLKEVYGMTHLVLVGDRGMIAKRSVEALRAEDGMDWITALKSVSIRTLVEQGHVQMDLFDERNLFELTHPDYPGERLVACRNPALATLRAHKREDLLAATQKNLEQVQRAVQSGRLKGADRIGLRVGKVVNQYKVAKHFELSIEEGSFTFQRKAEQIVAEAALDGLYIVRTSVSADRLDSADVVRHYKALAQVERAFRSLKTVDLKVRPIHHRLSDRVRAHIFLCVLAYYVQWHMQEAWRPILFADEDLQAKALRDPVAPAQRSSQAADKAARRVLDDQTPAHSLRTLLADLATVVRNTCRTDGSEHNFELTTQRTAAQARAFELLNTITV